MSSSSLFHLSSARPRLSSSPLMSSTISSPLRLLHPKLPLNHSLKKPLLPIIKTLFLKRFLISFQRLADPPFSQPHALRSHPQQQQSDSGNTSDPSSVDHITKLLPPALREIVSLFQSVGDDPKAKYQQLLYYGSQLPLLDPCFKDNDHRVRGCVSQVWVRAFPDPEVPGAVCFEADSDSALTKGLCALLVFGLSGSPASVITSVPPEFVLLLGLRQSLTPSRNNGFLNMLLLMQKKARELQFSEEESDFDDEEKNLTTNVNGWRPLDYAASNGTNDDSEEQSVLKDKNANFEVEILNENIASLEDEFDSVGTSVHVKDDNVDSRLSGRDEGRGERIKKLLEGALSPIDLDVEDISHLHAGHAGIGGRSSGGTHFNVRVVSEEFEGKSLVKRHRLVYELLQDELQSGLHSLSIVAKTPSEIKSSG